MEAYKTKMRMRGIYSWQGNIQALQGGSFKPSFSNPINTSGKLGLGNF